MSTDLINSPHQTAERELRDTLAPSRTPEDLSRVRASAARSRWTPDARTRRAVRDLVAQLRPLDEGEKAQLAALLKGGA